MLIRPYYSIMSASNEPAYDFNITPSFFMMTAKIQCSKEKSTVLYTNGSTKLQMNCTMSVTLYLREFIRKKYHDFKMKVTHFQLYDIISWFNVLKILNRLSISQCKSCCQSRSCFIVSNLQFVTGLLLICAWQTHNYVNGLKICSRKTIKKKKRPIRSFCVHQPVASETGAGLYYHRHNLDFYVRRSVFFTC